MVSLQEKRGYKIHFSDNLIHYLGCHRIRYDTFAESIDVSPRTIQKWIDAISLPRVEHMQRIAQETGVPIERWISEGPIGHSFGGVKE